MEPSTVGLGLALFARAVVFQLRRLILRTLLVMLLLVAVSAFSAFIVEMNALEKLITSQVTINKVENHTSELFLFLPPLQLSMVGAGSDNPEPRQRCALTLDLHLNRVAILFSQRLTLP